MPVYTDQLGRTLTLGHFPQRIVSIVPSQTELLFELGLEKEVVGITKFCVHPRSWFRTKPRVGGTKNLNLKIIADLRPDLIIGNKEENSKDQIEALEKHYPVWISDVKTLVHAQTMIWSVGEITGKVQAASLLKNEIENRFSAFLEKVPKSNNPKTAYLIWRDPYITAGGDTFISEMMKICGLSNIFEYANRYPEITEKDLLENGCRLLLLSSEPFPFKQQHAEELKKKLPQVRVMMVDGEIFSWYGSRLLKAPEYFARLLDEIGK
jgi:ABC-type Fe3+-hydroxamate transport system substrate-binding protein